MTLVQLPSRGSVLGRCALLVLGVLALLLSSVDARAQVPAVTGIVGPVVRVEPNGTNADSFSTGHPHQGGVPVNVINYEDCEADLRFELTLALSGTFPQYDLVAWAGPTDCTVATARTPGTATCWPVTAGAIAQTGALTDAGVQTTTVALSMRDIAAQAWTTPPATTYTPATSDACNKAQTGTAAKSFTIYFFFVDHIGVGNAIGTAAQPYPIVADMVAQTIGDNFSVTQPLDSQLAVAISAPSDSDTVAYNVYCDPPPGHETAINQVPYDAASNNGQCIADSSSANETGSDSASDAASDATTSSGSGDGSSGEGEGGEGGGSGTDGAADAEVVDGAPASPADAGLVDAGVAEGGGFDDAGGSSCGIPLSDAGVPYYGSCSSGSILQPGGGTTTTTLTPTTSDDGAITYVEAGVVTGGRQTLGIPAMYLCGTVPVGSPTLTLTGLRDGYYYNIAVAAVDGAGNVGPLAVTCGEPIQIADFWYNYTVAGGQAGGGFCSAAEGVGVPAGTSGLGVLMIASFVAILRKRRR
jgi:hypothetical protein